MAILSWLTFFVFDLLMRTIFAFQILLDYLFLIHIKSLHSYKCMNMYLQNTHANNICVRIIPYACINTHTFAIYYWSYIFGRLQVDICEHILRIRFVGYRVSHFSFELAR